MRRQPALGQTLVRNLAKEGVIVMTNTAQRPDSGSGQTYGGVVPTSVTGWAGWIVFGAFMMFMLGLFHAMAGLVALFKDDYFLVGSNGLVLNVDYTAWGWIHLLGGIAVGAAGVCVLLGQLWARIVAVIVTLLSALVNLAFLAAHPIWSTIMIALAVLVIWAVIVHGGEMKEA